METITVFKIINRSKEGVKLTSSGNRFDSFTWEEFNKMFDVLPDDKNKCKLKPKIYEEFSNRINWLMSNAPIFVPKLIFHDESNDLNTIMGLGELSINYLEKFKDDTNLDFINMFKQYKIIAKDSLKRLGGEVVKDNPTNIHNRSKRKKRRE